MNTHHTGIARLSLFAGLCALHVWATSIFSPWATSTHPLLWLYDTFFYTAFALLFWGLAEVAFVWYASRAHRMTGRQAGARLALVALAISFFLAHTFIMNTGAGLQARLRMSERALAGYTQPDYRDQRHRAGWFLIDTERMPCNQPWLWLGRPFGGGTGISMALVHSPDGIPRTPRRDTFRFWHIDGPWWMAYQNATYRATDAAQRPDGEQGVEVPSHKAGLQFIRNERAD